MTDEAARVLSDFEGAFRVRRDIVHADAPPAEFEGKAIWSSQEGGLGYFETGRLMIPGHQPMTSERRYFWDQDLNVYFDDGRFFHTVPPTGGQAAHWCDPDHYAVTYRFEDWPNFQVEWRVIGPHKDYTMVSTYRRET